MKKHYRFWMVLEFVDGQTARTPVDVWSWFEWRAYGKALKIAAIMGDDSLRRKHLLSWQLLRKSQRLSLETGGPVR